MNDWSLDFSTMRGLMLGLSKQVKMTKLTAFELPRNYQTKLFSSEKKLRVTQTVMEGVTWSTSRR